MDNIKIIYQILKALEEAMDYETFDFRRISEERFGISKRRLWAILEMMKDRGLIEGVFFEEDEDGRLYPSIRRVRITLAGIEYIEGNTAMRRMAKVMGIRDAIPGA